MKALLSALSLSLLVATAAVAQDAQPAAPAAPAPKTIVNHVRDAIGENDLKKAEKLVLDDINNNGLTPIAIEAFSWLGRGAVAAKNYDDAMTYAARTYEIVEEQLKYRKLDDEARLPIALGAAIEVQALALEGQGKRSEGLMLLRREIERYQGTSIITRLYKNVNLLSLEGQPALPWTSTEWLGPRPPALDALKGKPTIIFLWAHWCNDCKKQGPILEQLIAKYKDTGLTLIAPTQRFGYVDKKKPAGPEEELKWIETVRDQNYPWLKSIPVPVSSNVYEAYGVSTTPTLVFLDRDGKVAAYNPGQLTAEQLEPLIQKITAVSSSQ
jgi:thiol-disulfide isomerase/thioredoxin